MKLENFEKFWKNANFEGSLVNVFCENHFPKYCLANLENFLKNAKNRQRTDLVSESYSVYVTLIRVSVNGYVCGCGAVTLAVAALVLRGIWSPPVIRENCLVPSPSPPSQEFLNMFEET